MSKYAEPLTHQLIQVTKKYLNAFSDHTVDIPLERYHYALLLIDDHEECLTQKALAELLQVDKSFMVNMIDYLTHNGFVQRETNKEDRRQQIIKLTAKAKKMIPEINNSILTLNEKVFNDVAPEKVKTFFEIIDILQKNLKQMVTHEIVLNYHKLKS